MRTQSLAYAYIKVVAVGQLGNNGHARTVRVVGVRHVVNDIGPVDQVGRLLVHKLLTIIGIPLVRVVDDQGVFMDPEQDTVSKSHIG